uniref:Putative secreted protein n=1 Tax=Ixodes ricinus TaxID=34613 RepID=A0A6B0UC77_IXORI
MMHSRPRTRSSLAHRLTLAWLGPCLPRCSAAISCRRLPSACQPRLHGVMRNGKSNTRILLALGLYKHQPRESQTPYPASSLVHLGVRLTKEK